MRISILRVFALVAPLAVTTAAAAEQSSWGAGANDAAFQAMLKSGFREKGIAKLSRLDQDATQAFCSDPVRAASKEAAPERAKIEAANMATIKWPADGKWLGDWKEGEKVAQSGRGLTSSDPATLVNGGNCYNCHQLSPKEISFGTIGPSLYQYGKLRGATEDTLRYTWGRIYNAKAYNACSNMPRAGHMGIITEQQIRDLMALLLDPQSPVNQ
jgi:L-cysteine S-thiosulfotransferase